MFQASDITRNTVEPNKSKMLAEAAALNAIGYERMRSAFDLLQKALEPRLPHVALPND